MGKKKRSADNYDRDALRYFSLQLKQSRIPLQGGCVPQLEIDLDDLEKEIQNLPRKQRQLAEKIWGLIPGTLNHSKNLARKTDIAFQNMANSELEIKRNLTHFEHLMQYDKNLREVVEGLASKFDKAGVEEVSDEHAIKYLLLLIIFIACGPSLFVEEKNYQIDLKEEGENYFDEYAVLQSTWRETARFLPDHSIKLKILIDAISMFDVEHVIKMKRFVRLPISKDFENLKTEAVQTFAEIRLLKEEMFPQGSWDITTMLIYGSGKKEYQIDLSGLAKHFEEFRNDWDAIQKYKVSEESIVTTKGETKLDCYQIGGLEFTDVYEVMFLYLCRNLL